MEPIPVQIEKFSATEMRLVWSTGEKFALPFIELRYYCPCASCIDEHTGLRILEKDSIVPDTRPTGVQVIGRYAVQISWSDGHSTGMYHFDRLYELCLKQGQKIE